MWFKEDALFDRIMVAFFYLVAVGLVALVILTALGIIKPPAPYSPIWLE